MLQVLLLLYIFHQFFCWSNTIFFYHAAKFTELFYQKISVRMAQYSAQKNVDSSAENVHNFWNMKLKHTRIAPTIIFRSNVFFLARFEFLCPFDFYYAKQLALCITQFVWFQICRNDKNSNLQERKNCLIEFSKTVTLQHHKKNGSGIFLSLRVRFV